MIISGLFNFDNFFHKIDTSGIEFSPFAKESFISWNHGTRPFDIIAIPLELSKTEGDDFYLKAKLLDEKTAKYVQYLLLTGGKLSWSFEGVILEKIDNTVTKCQLRGMAIVQSEKEDIHFIRIEQERDLLT